jgi:DnaJ-class molecular chaperone
MIYRLIEWTVILCLCLWIYSFLRSGKPHSNNSAKRATSLNPQLKKAYEFLGCAPSHSDEDIKRCYRNLVGDAHVDALPRDLPDYLVEAANQRFREIQSAYELVMRSRRQ